MSTKRISLSILLTAIGIAAIFAVLALLGNGWNDLEFRVVCTSALVAITSILTMVCGAAWETQRSRGLALVGGLSSLLAGFLSIITIWTNWSGSELWWRVLATSWTVGVATSHASLLSMARLAPRFRWVLYSAFVSIFMLAAQLLQPVWLDHAHLDDRAVGINAVIVAALSLVVPLLHKLDAMDTAPVSQGHYACPGCGQAGQGPLGSLQCPTCQTRYQVTVLGLG